jgi:Cu(I)/Ag(I) efflux system membrane fusion protein
MDRVQSIGVRTAVVESVPAGRRVRVTASVAPTEQGLAQVHVRANGFVEQIAATQTGVNVGQGQALFSMYSPEIFQAQSELLAAAQWTAEAPAPGADANVNTRAAVAARRKLELLGMATKDIDRVVQTKTALRAIPVYAPQRGVVTKKNVVLGSYVTPDMTLYELQDLSKVYVVADVFPKDVAFVQKGMKARFALARRPEPPIEANVDLVYPVVDLDARTTRVRLTLKNAGLELRPGDFGTVELDAPSQTLLAVPRDAVVDTGRYAYVFVVKESGVFEPHVVALAGEEGERALIQSGVAAGDRVVSGATFLIDSESRLQAAVQSAGNAPPPAPAHGSH